MGRLSTLEKTVGNNAAESLGAKAVSGTPRSKATAMPERLKGIEKSKDTAVIPLVKIVADVSQPRTEFDPESLQRLADSLKTHGQLQPIRVRWDEGIGAYVVVAGERRWRAAGMAGLKSLTCVIAEGPYDEGMLLIEQLIENCLREDLRPIEQARAFRLLMDQKQWEVRELARQLAIDHAGISRALALLELPEAIQEKVEEGAISARTGAEIARAEPAEQPALAERVEKEGLTREQVREEVQQKKTTPKESPESTPAEASKTNGKSRGVVSGTTPVIVAKTREFTSPSGSVATFLMAAESCSDNDINDFLVFIRSLLKVTSKPKMPDVPKTKSKPKSRGKSKATV